MERGRCVDARALAEDAALGERADSTRSMRRHLAACGGRYVGLRLANAARVDVAPESRSGVEAKRAAANQPRTRSRWDVRLVAVVVAVGVLTLTTTAQHDVFVRRRGSTAESASLFQAVVAVSGETPFVIDGNRVYTELGFVRPDGAVPRARVRRHGQPVHGSPEGVV